MVAPGSVEQSTELACGEHRIADLGADVIARVGPGAPVLLVSDQGLVRAGLVVRAETALVRHGLEVAIFADLDGEPAAGQIDNAAASARQHQARLVVALGGGSALDAGKLAAAIAPADLEAEAYALAVRPLPRVPLPVIAIPTTAGTGSEMTRTAVFTDQAGRKVWAWGEALRPRLALLDPTLTTGLPAALTAISGLDALVHAIEAATGQRATPTSTGHALDAIRLVLAHLETAVRRPDDLRARTGMLRAACLAGRAIDASGTGVAHGLGHALGTLAKVPHGLAVALALRAALVWNAEPAPDRFRQIAQAMGLERTDDAQLGAALAARYDALLVAVDCTLDLTRYGLGAADAQRLTDATLAPENRPMLENNARPVDADAAGALVRRVLSGG